MATVIHNSKPTTMLIQDAELGARVRQRNRTPKEKMPTEIEPALPHEPLTTK